jgi:hypothetical protein
MGSAETTAGPRNEIRRRLSEYNGLSRDPLRRLRNRPMKHGKSPATPTPEPTPTPPPPAAPELYRRVVVLFVTGLIVARPLVLGEDPGLLDPLSDPGSLLLVLLWLVASVLWCVWRAWSVESFWHGGRVELALLALVGVQFVSAGVAAQYKHPAWLVAWEWLVVLIAFVLVRQLASSASSPPRSGSTASSSPQSWPPPSACPPRRSTRRRGTYRASR